ncbi:MAG: class II glutamine amidotransferase [Betaproteobacteria bacterium]|jgi:predicted glutamine amidotransferase|nr:class II glutamine amidotransferase [Betaproteobacteria bacterium]MBK7656588.1 class II glutamine amidotransferase [Betaproteobacteria bacterium]
MCQLLGMNSRLPATLNLSFTGFSQRGGCTDHHADGWGMAFFESDGDTPGKGVRCFIDKESAATSPLASMLHTYPVKSHNVVAHVRKATVGAVRLENCHPFVRELWGRYWVFAHNGDLLEFAPRLHGSFQPVGNTDSELAFCWIMQELSKSHAGVPSVEELSCTLRELVPRISKHGTFNFLLSNGQALWAHASTKLCYIVREYPFGEIQLKDDDVRVDLSELNGPDDRLAIVVTEPLTTNENWTHMNAGDLYTFVDGQPIAAPQCCKSALIPAAATAAAAREAAQALALTAASNASTNSAATSQPV